MPSNGAATRWRVCDRRNTYVWARTRPFRPGRILHYNMDSHSYRARTVGQDNEGAPAEPAGALRTSGRDYGADGLFRHGPQLAQPHWVRLIADAVNPPAAPSPMMARAQQSARKSERRRILARHARFLAAIAGDAVGRNRGRAA
jgi:hypothetical protein